MHDLKSANIPTIELVFRNFFSVKSSVWIGLLFRVWEWSEPILMLQPASTCFQKLYDPDLSVSTRADLFSEAVRPGATLFQKLYRSEPLVLRSCTTRTDFQTCFQKLDDPDRLSDLFSEAGRAGQTFRFVFRKWTSRTDLFSEAARHGLECIYPDRLIFRSCLTRGDLVSEAISIRTTCS